MFWLERIDSKFCMLLRLGRRSIVPLLAQSQRQRFSKMSQDVVTAYSVAIPEEQSQSMPGVDKEMKPHLEYTKLEFWNDEGKPSLVEYRGSGK